MYQFGMGLFGTPNLVGHNIVNIDIAMQQLL
jgi:hypothetical protein